MSVALGVPHTDHPYRPALQRSRSHSTPSQNQPPSASQDDSHDSSAPQPPKRPTHGRSQSYLSPDQKQPRAAATAPLEKSPDKSHRLHLPGKHHLHRDETKRHKYTQSETEQHHRLRRNPDGDESVSNLVAGLRKEGGRRTGAGGDSTMLSAVPTGLTRMTSMRSNRGADTATRGQQEARMDFRRRATSDPKQPQSLSAHVQKKSPIELDLERAERVRRQRKFTITKKDVERMDQEIEDAEEEMRERLADINSKGMEMTRRLDYGFYNLLEKVGGLVTTIQSFQSLAQQSRQLIDNFEHEIDRLDGDIGSRVKTFQKSFTAREEQVDKLESKGKALSTKAEDLGRRLENARTIVENWEKREDQAKKVWGRFWGGVWMSLITITITIIAIVLAKEWWLSGDPVKAGLSVPAGGSHNASLSLGDGKAGDAMLRQADLPPEVKKVLKDIEERNRQRNDFFVKPVPLTKTDGDGHASAGDEKIHMLDEL